MLEGVKFKPYTDLAGIPTVCSGYTGPGIDKNKTYSAEECNAFTRKELVTHGNGVLKCINKPLSELEYNAFTLFAYNIGVGAFCSSRTAKLFNEGRTKDACYAIAYTPNNQPNWSFVDGKFVQGLHNRRQYEMRMCLGATSN